MGDHCTTVLCCAFHLSQLFRYTVRKSMQVFTLLYFTLFQLLALKMMGSVT